jgi:AAA+ ATPase superfamily predicted ATPase
MITLSKFNINNIAPASAVVIIGKRNTGKSYLARDILKNQKGSQIPEGTVIACTDYDKEMYNNVESTIKFHDEFCSEVIEQVYSQQETKIRDRNRDTDKRSFLVLDNCFHDSECAKNEHFKRVMFNHIMLKLSIITYLYSEKEVMQTSEESMKHMRTCFQRLKCFVK